MKGRMLADIAKFEGVATIRRRAIDSRFARARCRHSLLS